MSTKKCLWAGMILVMFGITLGYMMCFVAKDTHEDAPRYMYVDCDYYD